MACFRAITAEEEAASSIFYIVKRKNYKNAKRIKAKDHVYKNSLYQYILAIQKFFSEKVKYPYQILFSLSDKKDKPAYIKIELPDGRFIEPIPPLNFNVKELPDNSIIKFDSIFIEMVNDLGKKDLNKYLKDLANQRNILLYASEIGVGSFRDNIIEYIDKKRRNVFTILFAYCLMFPYENSLFVQQLINGFLLSLKEINNDELIW